MGKWIRIVWLMAGLFHSMRLKLEHSARLVMSSAPIRCGELQYVAEHGTSHSVQNALAEVTPAPIGKSRKLCQCGHRCEGSVLRFIKAGVVPNPFCIPASFPAISTTAKMSLIEKSVMIPATI